MSGLTRSEIAAKFGISTGSVSNITGEYEEALAIVDLTTIRKSLKVFHKRGFTVKEFALLSQFINILEKSYETEGLRDSVDFKIFMKNIIESATNYHKFCNNYGISPDIIPLWIKDLLNFTPSFLGLPNNPSKVTSVSDSVSYPSTGSSSLSARTANDTIPFISSVSSHIANLKNECEKLLHLKNSLKEQLKNLRLEIIRRCTIRDQLYQEEAEAMQYLDFYYKVKEELHTTYNIKIEDIKHFAKAINEFAQRGYNVNDILSESEQLQAAPIKIMVLESEIEKLLVKKTAIMSDIRFYEFMVSGYLERMSKLDHLENIGFGYDHLVRLTKIIERISKNESISLKEAANNLLLNIAVQYSKELQLTYFYDDINP